MLSHRPLLLARWVLVGPVLLLSWNAVPEGRRPRQRASCSSQQHGKNWFAVRTRSLNPGFFKNEELAELDPWARLLFEGLWCMADREGRLEDRPKRIKGEIFPYDNVDAEPLLAALAAGGFIVRYEVENSRYIAIPAFLKHQHPHVKERPSTIQAPAQVGASTDLGSVEPVCSSVNTDNTDIPEPLLLLAQKNIPGWAPDPADATVVALGVERIGEKRLRALILSLATYQAANQKYKTPRRALANWINREEPEPPPTSYFDEVDQKFAEFQRLGASGE
jgi:hypothetical protein